MTLPDGRTEFLEIPGRWVTRDRSGETGFLPQAVYLLDRVRALAISASDRPPRPGYIRSLRQALGMTQADFAARVGVDKLTVSRWERGAVRPRPESLGAIERLRKRAARRGVTVPA
jgi:DNA-binding XRE family transcriptional regulator